MLRKTIQLISIIVVILLSLGLSPVLAAPVSIRYLGGSPAFEISADNQLDPSDLFAAFKDLMPGDQVTTNIQITNASQAKQVKFYLEAEPLDNLDSLTDYAKAKSNNLAQINDFLSKLEMKVWQSDQGQGQAKLIYQASPDHTGQLSSPIPLGSLGLGQETSLTVELSLPLELDNQAAGLVGEVHWLLTAEEGDKQPTSILDKAIAFISGRPSARPGLENQPRQLPSTGQKTNLLSLGLSLALLLIGCRLLRRQ